MAGAAEGAAESAAEPLYVAIAGLIGAGKSTLAASLAAAMGVPAYYEPVADNAYLADFYRDMRAHAFAMQVYLLNRRFEQQQQIVWAGRGGVQDRSIYEDSVFARMLRDGGHMDARDYDTYATLFRHMSQLMGRPSLIVYLDVPPEVSLARVRARGRECEAGVTLEYLRALHVAYESFIEEIANVVPVIRVDWRTFRDADDVAAAIRDEYRALRAVRRVDVRDRAGECT